MRRLGLGVKSQHAFLIGQSKVVITFAEESSIPIIIRGDGQKMRRKN
jgi:hypothetical protein